MERCSATAGLSLGECAEPCDIDHIDVRYNAICFSGMLTFEECLKVVRVRADAMHEDSIWTSKVNEVNVSTRNLCVHRRR